MLTLEQKEFRKTGLGGSDAPAVVGLSPYKSPFQLYLEKRGEAPEEEEATLAMELGNLLEEPIAQLYVKKTGRQIRRHPTRVSAEHPHMLVNVDRIVVNDPRGPGYLEIKTANDWVGNGIHGLDDLPDHFYIQGQHGLAVTEWQWMSFAILVGGSRFVWFDLTRNDEVIAELIKQEAEFWERVQTGKPPEIDGSERTGELIKRMYPKDTGKTITIAAPELVKAATDFTALKKQEKHIEEEIKRLGNMLKSAIGDASTAVFPGFGEITWKASKESTKESVDLVKLQADFPDAYSACFKSETVPGSRRFLPKPNKETK